MFYREATLGKHISTINAKNDIITHNVLTKGRTGI